ncbi:MAG: tryptophan-rich sensory protein [Clostridia bacterium]|nr:tryptophan-rich sensory protein [Clostridia bacterium]
MQNELSVNKPNKFWIWLGCVALTLGIGTLSGFLSGAMEGYEGINMPSFALPEMVYSIVWTVLYVLIGWALYLVIACKPTNQTERRLKTAAIVTWAVQFALNLLWPFIFFNVDFTIAFVINAAMFAVTTSLVSLCFFIRPASAIMLIPYWLWMMFAAYQTLMIIVLNA